MKKFADNALMVLLCLALVAIPTSCTVYKYKDCKKVGHSTFYCVFLNGSK